MSEARLRELAIPRWSRRINAFVRSRLTQEQIECLWAACGLSLIVGVFDGDMVLFGSFVALGAAAYFAFSDETFVVSRQTSLFGRIYAMYDRVFWGVFFVGAASALGLWAGMRLREGTLWLLSTAGWGIS